MKYQEWLDQWVEEYVKNINKLRTYLRYREIIDLHIKPALGEYDMDQLDSVLLQSYVFSQLKTGNVKTLAEILGHKNAIVTLNRYSHSMMSYKIDMLNKNGQKITGKIKICRRIHSIHFFE